MLARALLLATALAAVAGCSSPSTGDGAPGPVLTSQPVPGTGAVAELRQRRAQWATQGGGDYRFVLARSCFCVPEATRPTRVTVRDGQVVSAADVETGAARDLAQLEVPTIDQLFARAIEAAERGESIEVRYDERYGYPVHLMIGSLAADAGVGYDVSEVRKG